MTTIQNKINRLPWHATRRWDKRPLDVIDKIIIHQELGNGTIEQVNKYHITPGIENHLSSKGAPHFAYHYGIERDGTLIQANELDQITWHTKGQNATGVACMLVGNFSGPNHTGTNSPSAEQLISLEFLLDILVTTLPQISKDDIFGHCDFGKPACPGDEIMTFLKTYKTNLI